LGIRLTPEVFTWQRFYPGVVDKRQTACFLAASLTDRQANSITLGDEGQKWEFTTFEEFLHHPNAVEGMKTRLNDYLLS
jgi:8-oxo-dGTP diphosphatase